MTVQIPPTKRTAQQTNALRVERGNFSDNVNIYEVKNFDITACVCVNYGIAKLMNYLPVNK